MIKFLVTTLLLFCSVAASGAVYKWVDSGGRVHYSDKPPVYGAQTLNIKSQPTDPARIATARTEKAQAAELEQTAATDQARQTQQDAEQRARREENCSRAQRAINSLLSATRIYEPLPGGERRFLNEEEIAQRMASARADVDKWCNKKP